MSEEFGRRLGRKCPHSDAVYVKDFIESWNVEAFEAVRPKQSIPSEAAKFDELVEMMGVDEDTVKELSAVCDVSALTGPDPPISKKALLEMSEMPENCELECVADRLDPSKQSQAFKISISRMMKYRQGDEYHRVRPVEETVLEFIPSDQRVSVPNVILSVKITKCHIHKMAGSKVQPSEKYLVLGTQTLADLKDAMKCPNDEVIAGDYSCMPDSDPSQLMRAKDIYKSGFFFIENVFYNDLRNPDNHDYSKPILDWYHHNWSQEEKLKTGDMATTRFMDLTVKLGCYYLFTHQGNCEHSVLFEDIRLLSPDDCHNISMYPLQIYERISFKKRCQGCSKHTAKWVVFDSLLIPTDPCIFCKACFKSFLYTEDGKKTSNFKAHHYADF